MATIRHLNHIEEIPDRPLHNESLVVNDVCVSKHLIRLEETYSSSPVASVVIDEHEQVVFSNEAALLLLNVEQSCLTSLSDLGSISTIHHVEDLQESIQRHLSSRTSSPPWEGTLKMATDQSVEVHFIQLPLDGPRCTLCQFLVRRSENDQTHLELLEEIRRERGRLRAVLEHMPTAVMLFDTKGKVLDLNARAHSVVGRTTWTKLGEEDHPFVVCDTHNEPLPRAKWPLIRALEQGVFVEDAEFILDFGDVQRTISMSIVPIKDEADQITSYLVTGSDITQRSEKERRKDEFLSVASHELRSPLTPLSGFLHLCRKKAEAGEAVDPMMLERAQAQVLRLQRLIEGLLDVSRLDTGRLPIQFQTVSMTTLVRRIMEPWLVGRYGDRISLTLPEQTLQVRADPDRIDQVLTNLVDNAIKHGRCDGNIKVRLEAQKESAVLSVQDDGEGMSQEVIDRVFDRYFFGEDSTKEKTSKSLGLGLYLARQIVEAHGGNIRIDSNPSHPTRVTVTMPLLSE